MPRRKAWNGHPPETADEARRFLLDVARACIERFGPAKASLSDVADAAGVTRQTVYRYFDDADALFRAAAVLASGGFRERMRRRVLRRRGLAERMVETLVIAIREIPRDPHLEALVRSGEFTAGSPLALDFVREEMAALARGEPGLRAAAREELAELFLRLLHSFLANPGAPRSEAELRRTLSRWLVPAIEARMRPVATAVRR